MIDAGLILEGGAVRGVFTAGALDYLMEQNIWFSYVVGVSAGSCNALDYVSGQIGRTRDCFIPKDKANRYLSPVNFIRGRELYDLDKVFVDFPSETYPFDFKAYFNSPVECEMTVTNCLTGQAEYLQNKQERAGIMTICRASSSLPLVSPVVRINNVPYLDGGLADSVPIKRSIAKGYVKHFIILTRNAGYRKEVSGRLNPIYERKYREYPELIKAIEGRASSYNKCMEFIEELEDQGKVFVIRPEIKCISKMETSTEKLTAFYEHGKEIMKEKLSDLMEYLQG